MTIKKTRFRKLCVDYADIAKARGVTIHAVRKAASLKRFDPYCIKSVYKYMFEKGELNGLVKKIDWRNKRVKDNQ